MHNHGFIGTALAAVLLLAGLSTAPASAQDLPEDLSPCPGSAAEPAQSSTWPVAFCNRTSHDVVIEFRDNDCPANDWSRRGDVYQRTLRRGESKVFPLCYASEPAGKKLAPGVPALRIPGGKGVVTTWSVVGDCGERSRALNLDARTFYDRGDYRSGIILLQHPGGASHCFADASAPAAGSAPSSSSAAAGASVNSNSSSRSGNGAVAGAPGTTVAAQLPSPSPEERTNSSPPVNPATSAPTTSAPPRGNGPPILSAVIDAKDAIGRTVRVFAQDGAGYNCRFTLALSFTDGVSWNDKANADIASGDAGAPILTRKYLKSISKAEIVSPRCTAK